MDHLKGWRDSDTGRHSNDIESENAALKLWTRGRYSHLTLPETKAPSKDGEDDFPEEVELLDVYEYCHYVNLGKTMHIVMKSIGIAGGGASLKYKVA